MAKTKLSEEPKQSSSKSPNNEPQSKHQKTDGSLKATRRMKAYYDGSEVQRIPIFITKMFKTANHISSQEKQNQKDESICL